ncbi:MAG: hypothetical protein M3Q45_04165 [Chloroflexota bacterium]|nr:hypothetical protein [Chloroflexota bacterium]
MIFSLLPTKWHCPPLSAQQVQRPQLLARLNQGLAIGHNLTLVVAPAGFGKTILVSQWLEDLRAQHAPASDAVQPAAFTAEGVNVTWLSLDEYDNDLGRFLQYVAAAVQHVFSTACANLLPLLDAPQLPPLPDLATILINDLAALGAACILVLDDYQLIAEATIHQLLTRLLDHLPQSGGCQRQSQRIRCDDDLWGA